ncbi:MAG: DUF3307 domain-containing protein [Proteobacteria bacterium]|nr:DUF3307 domain-containing protein [Pseudomonadota bacterium]
MMTLDTVTLSFGLLLALKHFVADGPLQTAYMYVNKGKFLHPGGLIHAGLHGLGTLLALVIAGAVVDHLFLTAFLLLALADFVIHYFVDMTKVRLTKKYGWSGMGKAADGSACLQIYNNAFFVALMADQCLHFATYVVILAVIVAL